MPVAEAQHTLTLRTATEGPSDSLRVVIRKIDLARDTIARIEVLVPAVPIDDLKAEWTAETCGQHDHWPEGACTRAIEEWMSWPVHRPPVENAFIDRDRRSLRGGDGAVAVFTGPGLSRGEGCHTRWSGGAFGGRYGWRLEVVGRPQRRGRTWIFRSMAAYGRM